jgi:hypothetical protein
MCSRFLERTEGTPFSFDRTQTGSGKDHIVFYRSLTQVQDHRRTCVCAQPHGHDSTLKTEDNKIHKY